MNSPEAQKAIAVSPREAARMLSIGVTRLYEELGSGAIPSVHLGRRRLIRIAAREAWMAAREAEDESNAR